MTLVERLRSLAYYHDTATDAAMREAADVIERLTAERNHYWPDAPREGCL